MHQSRVEYELMENFAIGVSSSIVGGIILIIFGKWKGWWWKEKSQASIDLAIKSLKILEDELDQKTRDMVYASKQLADSLLIHYKNGSDYNQERESEAQGLIDELILKTKLLATELSAADKELDHLKRAVIAYQKGLEWRSQIIKHLCHPPNKPAMDAGHVRDQLLSENCLPHELLDAAKGEAALFLRGYGVGWKARRKYKDDIVKKHHESYKISVEKDYRKVLQQTALHKARK